ncbi:acyltransferase [Calothrix sp. HK-06]|nr:acyltransferase [Calothrix sp. HK-06]
MNKTVEKTKKLHLSYLDGLRGLTALYIVLVHVEPNIEASLPLFWSAFVKLLRYGGFAVVIFVVMSGYVLMLPVSRSEEGYIPGGLSNFFKRRARRILPPYYAALTFCFLLALGIFLLEIFNGFIWNSVAGAGPFRPKFNLIDILSHLFLIHNLSSDTHMSINPPMWSVATEWQIYFIFPLLLLPVRRRFGIVATIAVAYITGLIPTITFDGFFEPAFYIGIFSLGMLAAEIGFSQKPKFIAIKNSLPWNLLSIVFAAIGFITEWRKLGLHICVGYSFFGLAVVCLFISCTKSIVDAEKTPNILLKFFQQPWLIAVGTFSYSLYLTHGPILVLVRYWLFNLNLSPSMFAAASYIVGLGASLMFAYLFYLAFERPFMSNFLKKRKIENLT